MIPSSNQKIIYTIGHSTRSIEEFISLLSSFNIQLLVDIRTYPGSKRYPHFNKENLQKILPGNKMAYQHFPELGGRRKAIKDSKNNAWRNEGFRGYADYMETGEFKKAISFLEDIAEKNRTAYMCSEAVWWRCHRSLVSDYLKWRGWSVQHTMALNKSVEHPYTSAVKIIDGQLSYTKDQQSLF